MFYWTKSRTRYFSGSKYLVRIKASKPINESKQETNRLRIRPLMSQRGGLNRNNVLCRLEIHRVSNTTEIPAQNKPVVQPQMTKQQTRLGIRY